MLQQWNSGTAKAAEMLQKIWPSLGPSIAILAVLIVIERLLSGRLGSAIYNAIYFGIFFAAVAIWGAGVLVSPIFDVLYPVSYILTGFILRKIRG